MFSMARNQKFCNLWNGFHGIMAGCKRIHMLYKINQLVHISLLSVAGKIFFLVHNLSCPQEHMYPEKSWSESQSNCPGWSMERGIWLSSTRQLQEKCRELTTALCMQPSSTSQRLLSTVYREGLWRLLTEIWLPEKVHLIIRQFHEGLSGQDRDWWSKFGALLCYKLELETGMRPCGHDCSHHLLCCHAELGSLRVPWRRFNPLSLWKSVQTLQATCQHMDHWDTSPRTALRGWMRSGCRLSEDAVQIMTTTFASAAKNFGLTVSLSHTEHHVSSPRCVSLTLTLNIQSSTGPLLKSVRHFTYLGSILSSEATIDLVGLQSLLQSQRCIRTPEL